MLPVVGMNVCLERRVLVTCVQQLFDDTPLLAVIEQSELVAVSFPILRCKTSAAAEVT